MTSKLLPDWFTVLLWRNCEYAYLVGAGELHALILWNEDVSAEHRNDHSRYDDVGHLDAVVVHLGRKSDDKDPVEYRRYQAHADGDDVQRPVAQQETLGALLTTLVEEEEDADAEWNAQRHGEDQIVLPGEL